MPYTEVMEITEQDIERYVNRETTAKALSREYGVHYATMRRHLVARGCVIRPTARKEIDLDAIRALHEEGLSQKDIAARLGVSQVSVSRRMRREMDIYRGLPWQKREREGTDHTRWKGGRRMNGNYAEVWLASDHPFRVMANALGYVGEHRLVMAQVIGRALLPTETVHHIDGDRSNNLIDNLQLRQGRHGTGVKMVCNQCGSHDVSPTTLD